MGKMHVTILRSDGEVELIRVHVMMEVATVFIVLNKEEGRWPYRIDNKSSWDISFCQHVCIILLELKCYKPYIPTRKLTTASASFINNIELFS